MKSGYDPCKVQAIRGAPGRSGNSGVYSIKGLRYGVNHRAAGTTTWVHTYTGSHRDWATWTSGEMIENMEIR